MNNDCASTDCGFHYRMDEATNEAATCLVQMVTYKGDYAVVTRMNPLMSSLMAMVDHFMDGGKAQGLFSTFVVKVGTGVVVDASMADDIVWYIHHDEDDTVKNVHEDAVARFDAGNIDLAAHVTIDDVKNGVMSA